MEGYACPLRGPLRLLVDAEGRVSIRDGRRESLSGIKGQASLSMTVAAMGMLQASLNWDWWLGRLLRRLRAGGNLRVIITGRQMGLGVLQQTLCPFMTSRQLQHRALQEIVQGLGLIALATLILPPMLPPRSHRRSLNRL